MRHSVCIMTLLAINNSEQCGLSTNNESQLMRKKENKQEKGRNIQSVYMSQGPAEDQIFANQTSLSQKGGGDILCPPN